MEEEKKVYTVTDVMNIMNLSRSHTYDWIKEVLSSREKPFKVMYIGKTYRIHKASFDKWLNSQT